MGEKEKARIEHAQQSDTNKIFTLPNFLSFFRILLIPVIIVLHCKGQYWWAFGLLLLSGATDVVDGWIARTFHLVSDFGKAIDPVADKLTQIIRGNDIQSVTIVRMEVPCCGGLEHAAREALRASGKFLPWQVVTISVDGKILDC